MSITDELLRDSEQNASAVSAVKRLMEEADQRTSLVQQALTAAGEANNLRIAALERAAVANNVRDSLLTATRQHSQLETAINAAIGDSLRHLVPPPTQIAALRSIWDVSSNVERAIRQFDASPAMTFLSGIEDAVERANHLEKTVKHFEPLVPIAELGLGFEPQPELNYARLAMPDFNYDIAEFEPDPSSPKEIFNLLRQWIEEFASELNAEEEVGLMVVNAGSSTQFYLESIVYSGSPMMKFKGVDENNRQIQLIQYVTQTSIMLVRLPKLEPEAPKRSIGFHDDGA